MADEIVASEKQFQEYAERLSSIANDAASKIIEARDKASREMVSINERMRELLSNLKTAERQEAALSSLTDRAVAMHARLESLEDSLGLDEDHADKLLGLVGQVVRIKSNPDVPMTAAAVGEDGRIVCVWMDGDGYMEASIPFAALEVVDKTLGNEVKADAILLCNLSHYEFDFSVRTLKSLAEAGIKSVGDLVQREEFELTGIPGIGRKAITEIKENLSDRGLSLGMRLENWPPPQGPAASEGGAK